MSESVFEDVYLNIIIGTKALNVATDCGNHSLFCSLIYTLLHIVVDITVCYSILCTEPVARWVMLPVNIY